MADASTVSLSIACLAAMLALGCGSAGAGSVDDLYRAQTIVTGQGEESRRLGFAECLEQVLVKVSGDPRLLDDPGVAALAGQADAFVAEFHYRDRMAGIPVHDEQGTRDRPYDLTVSFHPAKIDAALRSLGREPWRASRPRLVVLLGVRLGTTYVLASDGDRGRDQREALTAAAERFGMPMALPDQAALSAAGLSYQKLAAADPSDPAAIARMMGGDLPLIGSMLWSEEALGWIAAWRLATPGKTYRWQIRGVSFDDAFRHAMAGAAQILSGHGQPG
ncbi:MAG TPA: DUF2066 domain-containing protein [Geminicoccaceae bacterium]|nr:DUF2066 domain-containing protein [Geminicoccaceae bacterium]